MTPEEDIEALKARIAQAEIQRDAWRVAGREERFLEAYFMVEALELQLDKRLRQVSAGEPSSSS